MDLSDKKQRNDASSGHSPLLSSACNRRNSHPPGAPNRRTPEQAIRLFELLLGSELVGVSALLLALHGSLAKFSPSLYVAQTAWYLISTNEICRGFLLLGTHTQLTALGGRRA